MNAFSMILHALFIRNNLILSDKTYKTNGWMLCVEGTVWVWGLGVFFNFGES